MEKCAFRSPIGRPPPHRDLLRKRVLRILGRSRKNPFVWECGSAGFGIRAHFRSYIENKAFPSPWYQLEGSYRCIKAHIDNICNITVIPSQHKRKLFHLLSPEYLFDQQSFAQDFYSRLKVLSTLTFDILQKCFLLLSHMRGGK